MDLDTDGLLSAPSADQEHPTLTRTPATYHASTEFDLAKGDAKQYKQQYGDMYFMRLAMLKPSIEKLAAELWTGTQIGEEKAYRVERVLDVRQGDLCWVVGTVYMDMPLKPNILEDISRDHWIAAPPDREKYLSPDGQDKVMLEDESGRLRLIGPALHSELVTGCIIAVLGTENVNGDFKVIDLKIPDLPQIPRRWTAEPKQKAAEEQVRGGKVALISGLDITGDSGNMLALDLLTEWLLGESASPREQKRAASVSRLIIAGNSLAESNPLQNHDESVAVKKNTSAKKYGYDASAYDPAPPAQLDQLLSTLLPSLPVTLLPGVSDPANVSLPQQPLHPALFPQSRAYASRPTTATKTTTSSSTTPAQPLEDQLPFHPATNPCAFSLQGHRFLGTSGQNITDITKYLRLTEPTPTPAEILDLMEHTLRWRLVAPTAPDTLWCYPYQSMDPFVLAPNKCPQVYFVGNMPAFAAGWAEREDGAAPRDADNDEQMAGTPEQATRTHLAKGDVRLVAIPKFSETSQVVLLDLETLDVELVEFGAFDASA